MKPYQHQPVLVQEVLSYLAVGPNKHYIDGTVGGGGHSEAILRATAPRGKVLALDQDTRAIAAATSRLHQFGARAIVRRENYKQITKLRDDFHAITPISGFLLDLGVSSDQLDAAGRGFSFSDTGILDMRFRTGEGRTAAELLMDLSEVELGRILREYGDERNWKRIARSLKQLSSKYGAGLKVPDVVAAIEQIIPHRITKIHPATKTFQALRIATNQELLNLEQALPEIVQLLPAGARFVIISFHSSEDRIVKHYFQRESRDCICPPRQPVCTCNHQASLKIITKKAVKPSLAEIKINPRSRSAILRAAERI